MAATFGFGSVGSQGGCLHPEADAPELDSAGFLPGLLSSLLQ